MKVIDPRKLIEEYLIGQGYLPVNPQNAQDATRNAILEGAARGMIDLLGVNFNEVGYCWDTSVKDKTSVITAFYGAVEDLESALLSEVHSFDEEMSIINNKIKKL